MHVLYLVNHDAGDIYGEMDSNVLFDIKMIVTDKLNRSVGLHLANFCITLLSTSPLNQFVKSIP